MYQLYAHIYIYTHDSTCIYIYINIVIIIIYYTFIHYSYHLCSHYSYTRPSDSHEDGDRNEHRDVAPEIFVLAGWEHSQGNLPGLGLGTG